MNATEEYMNATEEDCQNHWFDLARPIIAGEAQEIGKRIGEICSVTNKKNVGCPPRYKVNPQNVLDLLLPLGYKVSKSSKIRNKTIIGYPTPDT